MIPGRNFPYPGTPLDYAEGVRVISRMRRKYYQGPAERNLLSPEEIEMHIQRNRARGWGKLILPDDIREYRLKHYGQQHEELSLTNGGMVLTWMVFPESSLPVRMEIFSNRQFLQYERVYFSRLTTGQYVYRASPTDVKEFFTARLNGLSADYFVFDEQLKWCIAVTHHDLPILAGDFQVF